MKSCATPSLTTAGPGRGWVVLVCIALSACAGASKRRATHDPDFVDRPCTTTRTQLPHVDAASAGAPKVTLREWPCDGCPDPSLASEQKVAARLRWSPEAPQRVPDLVLFDAQGRITREGPVELSPAPEDEPNRSPIPPHVQWALLGAVKRGFVLGRYAVQSFGPRAGVQQVTMILVDPTGRELAGWPVEGFLSATVSDPWLAVAANEAGSVVVTMRDLEADRSWRVRVPDISLGAGLPVRAEMVVLDDGDVAVAVSGTDPGVVRMGLDGSVRWKVATYGYAQGLSRSAGQLWIVGAVPKGALDLPHFQWELSPIMSRAGAGFSAIDLARGEALWSLWLGLGLGVQVGSISVGQTHAQAVANVQSNDAEPGCPGPTPISVLIDLER